MDERIIAAARENYRQWAARPWYVKLWDRIASECGYIVFRLRGK
jgi:hypothetical protein